MDSNPLSPTGLTVHRSTETSIWFQWDPMQNAESYDWKLLLSGEELQSGNVTVRNVEVSGLSKGVTYQFAVRSVKGEFASDYCSYDRSRHNIGEAKAPTIRINQSWTLLPVMYMPSSSSPKQRRLMDWRGPSPAQRAEACIPAEDAGAVFTM
ncbi:MAG: fibronectin type III domain-containing protein [Candidatus Cryptobacteroides sp.]